MTDPITTQAGIYAIKKLLDWATSKSSKDPKVLGMVTDAQSQIIELQQAISKRDTKIREQEDELRKLQELGDLEFNDGCYWEKKGDGWDGPFCAACKGGKGKKIHMDFPGIREEQPQCPFCNNLGQTMNPTGPCD